jgi:hypothetical protein
VLAAELVTIDTDKRTTAAKKKFYNDILNEEEACFFEYTGVRGKPLCDGYDNFGKLVSYNEYSNNNRPAVASAAPIRSHPNPTTLTTATPTSSRWQLNSASLLTGRSEQAAADRVLSRRGKEQDKERQQPRKPSAGELKRAALSAQAEFFNKLKLQNEMDNEKRHVQDMFKANNHRSLTFKSVTLN